MKRLATLYIMMGLMILALAACDSGEDPSVAFCNALTELHQTSPTIAALGDAADLAQIVQLGTAMDNNWQTLSSSAGRMADSVQTTFAPFDQQYTAIPSITQETAMPVARETLNSKNGIASQTYDALFAGNCG